MLQISAMLAVRVHQPLQSRSAWTKTLRLGWPVHRSFVSDVSILFLNRGVGMEEESVRLAPREQQIADLLLQGCDNAEIGKELKMARRTVKAHFNRLFVRFGIKNGIKRVKLATLLYRRQLCLENQGSTANAALASGNNA